MRDLYGVSISPTRKWFQTSYLLRDRETKLFLPTYEADRIYAMYFLKGLFIATLITLLIRYGLS